MSSGIKIQRCIIRSIVFTKVKNLRKSSKWLSTKATWRFLSKARRRVKTNHADLSPPQEGASNGSVQPTGSVSLRSPEVARIQPLCLRRQADQCNQESEDQAEQRENSQPKSHSQLFGWTTLSNPVT